VGEVLATRFVLFNQTVAIRRAAFEKLGGFDESLKYLEDYDLPLRLALEGPWAFINEPLVVYGGVTAGSFSQRALNDPITLKRCELAIFGKVLARLEGSTRHTRMQMFLKRRLWRFRQELKEINLQRMNLPAARSAASLMRKLSHCEDALFRRSPWFPKVIAEPVEAARLSC
jgi:GT2 family glycosyltransferase